MHQATSNKERSVILVTILIAGVLLYSLFTTGSDSAGARTMAAIAGEPASPDKSIVGAGLWWP